LTFISIIVEISGNLIVGGGGAFAGAETTFCGGKVGYSEV